MCTLLKGTVCRRNRIFGTNTTPSRPAIDTGHGKWKYWLLVRKITIILAVMSSFVLVGQARADSPVTRVEIPASVLGPLTNPCTGEVLVFDGTIVVMTTTIDAANGSEHSLMQFDLSGVLATSTTGAQYQVAGGLRFESNVDVNGATTFTNVGGLLIISSGQSSSLVQIGGIHVTFTPTGQVIGVSTGGFGPDCVGYRGSGGG
jgi:hypothetical protein